MRVPFYAKEIKAYWKGKARHNPQIVSDTKIP